MEQKVEMQRQTIIFLIVCGVLAGIAAIAIASRGAALGSPCRVAGYCNSLKCTLGTCTL